MGSKILSAWFVIRSGPGASRRLQRRKLCHRWDKEKLHQLTLDCEHARHSTSWCRCRCESEWAEKTHQQTLLPIHRVSSCSQTQSLHLNLSQPSSFSEFLYPRVRSCGVNGLAELVPSHMLKLHCVSAKGGICFPVPYPSQGT